MCKYFDKITKYENDDIHLVFYSSWCGFSMKLLHFLKDKQINHKGYEVSNDFKNVLKDLIDNKDKLVFDPEHDTRPIVFYKGKFIGGATDTISKLS
jgi:glutaredoxin-related protein